MGKTLSLGLRLMMAAIVAVLLSGCQKETTFETVDDLDTDENAAVSGPSVPAKGFRPVLGWDFEKDAADWRPTAASVRLSVSTATRHDGAAALQVEGTSPTKAWGFLSGPAFDLQPRTRYRLSAWENVQRWSAADLPPFIKCQVDRRGAFVENYLSAKYDLARKGEWQLLAAEFTTDGSTGLTGLFSLEKGADNRAVDAVVFLDNVSVEAE